MCIIVKCWKGLRGINTLAYSKITEQEGFITFGSDETQPDEMEKNNCGCLGNYSQIWKCLTDRQIDRPTKVTPVACTINVLQL
jgi:hypothetical protein